MCFVHLDMHLPLQTYTTVSDLESENILQESSAPG